MLTFIIILIIFACCPSVLKGIVELISSLFEGCLSILCFLLIAAFVIFSLTLL